MKKKYKHYYCILLIKNNRRHVLESENKNKLLTHIREFNLIDLDDWGACVYTYKGKYKDIKTLLQRESNKIVSVIRNEILDQEYLNIKKRKSISTITRGFK